MIVYADDPEKWADESRFVRAIRPDQRGAWQIRGLPTGDYLAVAVDYVEQGMWNDPEYLDALRRLSQKLTLSDGSSQVLALKLVQP